MNPTLIPELFCLISANLNDKGKIFLTSCSKITSNLKPLLKLDSEHNLEEIINKYYAKNIIINKFSLESKELIKNLIPESIIVHSKYVKFISNNINIKLFHNEKIIKKIISCESEEDEKVYSYLTMKIMLNNDESIENINNQLIQSIKYGYLNVAKLLINLGADINVYDNEAIIVASYWGYLDIVKLLIDHGADIHARDDRAIISASYGDYLDVIKLLIDYGADVSDQNNSAIINASSRGHLSVVELLMEHGANIHARINGAIRNASHNGHLDMVRLLIDHEADIRVLGNQAIINASSRGHLSVVKLLMDHGADIHARNNEALKFAKLNGHLDVVELLEKN